MRLVSSRCVETHPVWVRLVDPIRSVGRTSQRSTFQCWDSGLHPMPIVPTVSGYDIPSCYAIDTGEPRVWVLHEGITIRGGPRGIPRAPCIASGPQAQRSWKNLAKDPVVPRGRWRCAVFDRCGPRRRCWSLSVPDDAVLNVLISLLRPLLCVTPEGRARQVSTWAVQSASDTFAPGRPAITHF